MNTQLQLKNFFNKIIPYIPLIAVMIVFIAKPYYLFLGGGDTDFHLIRAHEILLEPFHGIYWDYLVYYPMGRALWHPPLFHTIFALLWSIIGVRYANTILVLAQVFLTVFVASFIGKKEYGTIAGFFAGMFSLATPRVDMFCVALPAMFIPILATLTIYFLPKHRFRAFLTALMGIWTHMIGLIIFIPLFLVDGYKKNWKYILLLIPSVLFWGFYSIYFLNESGAANTAYPPFFIYPVIQIFSLLILLVFGFLGLYLLYGINNKKFLMILTYIIIVFITSYTDISRGFMYAALPLAILSGLSIQIGYKYLLKNYKKSLSTYLIIITFLISFCGVLPLFSAVCGVNADWEDINTPINRYSPLSDYILNNTNKNDVLWGDPVLADKIAWMTGRRVSNGRYGPPDNFVETHQTINIYMQNNSFLIKDMQNRTLKKIDNVYISY